MLYDLLEHPGDFPASSVEDYARNHKLTQEEALRDIEAFLRSAERRGWIVQLNGQPLMPETYNVLQRVDNLPLDGVRKQILREIIMHPTLLKLGGRKQDQFSKRNLEKMAVSCGIDEVRLLQNLSWLLEEGFISTDLFTTLVTLDRGFPVTSATVPNQPPSSKPAIPSGPWERRRKSGANAAE